MSVLYNFEIYVVPCIVLWLYETKTTNCQTFFVIVRSYLPFFLYDATPLENDNNRESVEEVISFHLILGLSFPLMCAVYRQDCFMQGTIIKTIASPV